MYLITHIYEDFITTTIVCLQSDIFHQFFSLRINKFIIQYFRSLLCFAGSLSENEFLIVFSLSFSNISIDLLQHSNFQASKLFINVPLQEF